MNETVVLTVLFWAMCWLFFYAYAFDRRVLIKIRKFMTFGVDEDYRLLQNENFIAKCQMGAFTTGVAGTILTVVLVRGFLAGA